MLGKKMHQGAFPVSPNFGLWSSEEEVGSLFDETSRKPSVPVSPCAAP